jgi:hypothetical protein
MNIRDPSRAEKSYFHHFTVLSKMGSATRYLAGNRPSFSRDCARGIKNGQCATFCRCNNGVWERCSPIPYLTTPRRTICLEPCSGKRRIRHPR